MSLKTTVNHGTPIISPFMVLALSIAGISFGSLFTKLAEAQPLAIAFYRILFAMFLLAPLTLSKSKKELVGIKKRDLFMAIASGMFLALHFLAWITSLKYTSVASATTLVALQPIFVVMGSALFLAEKVPAKALASVGIALIGGVVIGYGDFQMGGTALWGDFLALLGAILMACYLLAGRRLRQKLSNLAYIFVVYGSCSVILVVLSLITDTELTGFSQGTWLCFLALAVIPTILGHSLFSWCLAYLKASVVSVSILGEPVGATILAMLFLGEMPSIFQVLGGITIILGIFLFMSSVNKEEV